MTMEFIDIITKILLCLQSAFVDWINWYAAILIAEL
jgi:hypothetical protein